MKEAYKVTIACICIISLVFTAVIIIYFPRTQEIPVMTAMTKTEKAIALSKNWTNDSTLVAVQSTGKLVDGKSEGWRYSFISPSTARNNSMVLEYDQQTITIYANGKITTSYWNHSILNAHIINWTIDSNRAYKIYSNDPLVKEKIIKKSMRPEYFTLRMEYGYSANNAIWDIHFGGGIFDPLLGTVIMDAKVGTIISVTANR